jgi:hypothetical protein
LGHNAVVAPAQNNDTLARACRLDLASGQVYSVKVRREDNDPFARVLLPQAVETPAIEGERPEM